MSDDVQIRDLGVQTFERDLGFMMKELRKNGQTRQGLLLMAKVMQEEMSGTKGQSLHDVPHAWAMENLMRAIIAVLKGDRSRYVTATLDHGYKCMLRCLTE